MACKDCGQAIGGWNAAKKAGVDRGAWLKLRFHKRTCPQYKGSREPEPKEPMMPSFVADEHRTIGKAKVKASIEHVNAAAEALDAACRDLGGVINANRLYRDIAKLSDQARETRREINFALTVHEIDFALDREPTDDDRTNVHHGCGMQSETEKVARLIDALADDVGETGPFDVIFKIRTLAKRLRSAEPGETRE